MNGNDPTRTTVVTEYHSRPAEHSRSWQRHVMILLWIILAVALICGGVLMYAKNRGWMSSTPNHPKPPAGIWPEGQP